MHEYTQAAFTGDAARAKVIFASMEPIRHAFKSSRPTEKPQAHSKYWQQLLGQVGGAVRRPMLELSSAEKTLLHKAFETSGIKR